MSIGIKSILPHIHLLEKIQDIAAKGCVLDIDIKPERKRDQLQLIKKLEITFSVHIKQGAEGVSIPCQNKHSLMATLKFIQRELIDHNNDKNFPLFIKRQLNG